MLSLIGRFWAAKEFWHIFSELNPEHIRTEAERPFRILLMGAPGCGKTTMAHALAGGIENWAHVADVIKEMQPSGTELPAADGNGSAGQFGPEARAPVSPGDRPAADLCIYLVDATLGPSAADRAALATLRRERHSFVVFFNKCDLVTNLAELRYLGYTALGDVPADHIAFGSVASHEEVETTVARLLLRALPGRRLALARRLPALRALVADEVVVETARVNAEFALLSNLPANIPVVGGILGGGADFLVLTKNQVMMLFKLGAIHGRDIRSKLGLAAEVAPVVGSAFVWRTVSRELVGMLPTLVAAVPKTAIGYVGTFVVGKMAQYYFAVGTRPSGQMVKQFVAEANRRWRHVGEWRPPLRQFERWPRKSELEG